MHCALRPAVAGNRGSCLGTATERRGRKDGDEDMGAISVQEMHESLYSGKLRIELRSPAAQREGGVHNLYSYEKRLF